MSTGLAGLDDAISAGKAAAAAGGGGGGGFARGTVSEVYGPPGVGKTCLLYLSLSLSFFPNRVEEDGG